MTRDDNGRFVKGTSGNPKGRTKRQVEDTYLQAFRDSVSPDDWGAIIARAVSDAKKGDAVARKFIADYLIGQPVQRSEVTGKDGGPLTMEIVESIVEAEHGNADEPGTV